MIPYDDRKTMISKSHCVETKWDEMHANNNQIKQLKQIMTLQGTEITHDRKIRYKIYEIIKAPILIRKKI